VTKTITEKRKGALTHQRTAPSAPKAQPKAQPEKEQKKKKFLFF